MREEQLFALREYIEAVVKEKIEEAFGRDSLNESIQRHEAEDQLAKVFDCESSFLIMKPR